MNKNLKITSMVIIVFLFVTGIAFRQYDSITGFQNYIVEPSSEYQKFITEYEYPNFKKFRYNDTCGLLVNDKAIHLRKAKHGSCGFPIVKGNTIFYRNVYYDKYQNMNWTTGDNLYYLNIESNYHKQVFDPKSGGALVQYYVSPSDEKLLIIGSQVVYVFNLKNNIPLEQEIMLSNKFLSKEINIPGTQFTRNFNENHGLVDIIIEDDQIRVEGISLVEDTEYLYELIIDLDTNEISEKVNIVENKDIHEQV